MKAIHKKEGKRPWPKTAIYRRKFKRFRAFQAAFMAVAAAQGQARVASAKLASAPVTSVALMVLESQEAIIRASKYAEKWRL